MSEEVKSKKPRKGSWTETLSLLDVGETALVEAGMFSDEKAVDTAKNIDSQIRNCISRRKDLFDGQEFTINRMTATNDYDVIRIVRVIRTK